MENTLIIATTILNQLGGNRFLSMTGSKNLLNTGKGLRMDLTANKAKCNRLEITLEKDDTYTMFFYKVQKVGYDFNIINQKKYERIYFDDLQTTFTAHTGLYTKL